MDITVEYCAILWEEFNPPLDMFQYILLTDICNKAWKICRTKGVSRTPESAAIHLAKQAAIGQQKKLSNTRLPTENQS